MGSNTVRIGCKEVLLDGREYEPARGGALLCGECVRKTLG
jgi:hypothetical protein